MFLCMIGISMGWQKYFLEKMPYSNWWWCEMDDNRYSEMSEEFCNESGINEKILMRKLRNTKFYIVLLWN